MLQTSIFAIKAAVANHSEAMESGDHYKNGVSLKNHTSKRKKILFLLMACITLCGSIQAQSDLTYNMWTGVRLDGKYAKPKQIREVLAVNRAALKHYNTGKTLEQVGKFVSLAGVGLIAADMISNGFDNFGVGTLYFAGYATVGVSLAFLIPGTIKIGNAVRLYNEGLSNKSYSFQVNFGITPSGGVGLTMRF